MHFYAVFVCKFFQGKYIRANLHAFACLVLHVWCWVFNLETESLEDNWEDGLPTPCEECLEEARRWLLLTFEGLLGKVAKQIATFSRPLPGPLRGEGP